MIYGFSYAGHAGDSAVPERNTSGEMSGDLENAANGSNLGGNPTDGSGRAKDSPVSSWKSYFKFPMMDKKTKIFAAMVLGSVAGLSTVGAGSQLFSRRRLMTEEEFQETTKRVKNQGETPVASYKAPDESDEYVGIITWNGDELMLSGDDPCIPDCQFTKPITKGNMEYVRLGPKRVTMKRAISNNQEKIGVDENEVPDLPAGSPTCNAPERNISLLTEAPKNPILNSPDFKLLHKFRKKIYRILDADQKYHYIEICGVGAKNCKFNSGRINIKIRHLVLRKPARLGRDTNVMASKAISNALRKNCEQFVFNKRQTTDMSTQGIQGKLENVKITDFNGILDLLRNGEEPTVIKNGNGTYDEQQKEAFENWFRGNRG